MWPNPQETADLVTFTEVILNGKLHFLWNVSILVGQNVVRLPAFLHFQMESWHQTVFWNVITRRLMTESYFMWIMERKLSKSCKLSKLIIASSDIKVLVCPLYCFTCQMYFTLDDLWIICGSFSRKLDNVHGRQICIILKLVG